MNEVVNKLLLAGEKFMSEMQLKHPEFTNNASGLFTKNKERTQEFKEAGDASYTGVFGHAIPSKYARIFGCAHFAL